MEKEKGIYTSMMGEKAYYTKHIATNLNVSTETVRRWIRSGKLKSFQYGKDYVVTQSQLEEFLKGSKK